MKKATKKLRLHRETLLRLGEGALDKVNGGVPTFPCTSMGAPFPCTSEDLTCPLE